MKLLWAIRYDTGDWAIKKKWKDYYAVGEIASIPPLKSLGTNSAEAWKITVRGPERYEVEIAQGTKVLKARVRGGDMKWNGRRNSMREGEKTRKEEETQRR